VRLVKVVAPVGTSQEIAEIAFSAGVQRVGKHQIDILEAGQAGSVRDVIEVESATPTAKLFIDQLIAAPFFNTLDYSITVRQPRSITNHEPLSKITRPLVEPSTDICEELWQFSQITFGFIGRIFLGATLLACGLINYNLLLIIAGLLFIPLLPLMLAAGFGFWTRQFRLAAQGLAAFITAVMLLIAAGAIVAFLAGPPLRYNEFSSLLTGVLLSLVVGVAAGLATADDVGRREMIGLAATAQVAILPAWFGICFVFGFPALDTASPGQHALAFLLNVAAIILASFLTYALLGMKPLSLKR
jgi:hypothetical protein